MLTKAVKLDQLLLDPNNYRVRGDQNYREIDLDKVDNPLIQKRILNMITGENSEKIHDLMDSFKENNFLKIDNILVKKFKDKFVVIEGNRRVATLITLAKLHEQAFDIGKLDSEVFTNLEVVLYDTDDKQYSILMGLRHVSGVKQWGDYEQSELIMNLTKKYDMDVKEISESLGIDIVVVKKRLNTFIALEKFKTDLDYGTYFVANKYSAIFYELMGKPAIRDTWLEWDETVKDFLNKPNFKRLLSWLIPDNEEQNEAIITKRDEIRHLSKFILDSEALEKLEETRSVTDAIEESQYFSKEGFKKSLRIITKNIKKLNIGTIVDLDSQELIEVKTMREQLAKRIDAIDKLLN